MTMGTASTMASMVEALGVALPGNAAIPAVDSRRYRQAQLTGRRIVEMVEEDMELSKILTRAAFENAIRVNAAIGGSTNAVIHLLAIAGRIGVKLDAGRLGPARLRVALPGEPAALGQVPDGRLLLRGWPAGGDARDLSRARHAARSPSTASTIGENIADAPCWNRDVIYLFANHSRPRPVSPCCAAISRPTAR